MMTSLRFAIVAAFVLVSSPAVVSAAEFEHTEDQQVDAVHAKTDLYLALLSADPESGPMRLDAAYVASVVPADSEMAAILRLLMSLRPALPAVDLQPVAVSDVEEQSQALIEEGISAQAEAHATEASLDTQLEVRAGEHEQSAGASADAGDLPITANDTPIEAAAADEATPQEERPDPEPSASQPSQPVLAAAAGHEVLRPVPVPVALAATAVALGASASTAILAVPGWRSALLRLLRRFGWLVLFSRIAQEDILSHERRSELLEFVRNNPGERIEVARRTLGFSNGSMHYHLRVLQDRGLIRIIKERNLARLYPRGPKITPAPYVPAQRKRFVDALSATPGKTQRELAAILGLSERMVSYHVRALASQGLVEIRADGARKRLFPVNMCAAAALAPAA